MTTSAHPHPVDAALAVLGELGQRDVPLGPRTTYRVGGPAAVFVEAGSVDDLRRSAQAATASGLPILVLGRGSNMLVADRGVLAIVVALGEAFERIDIEGTTVTAGGAVSLPVLARRTAAAGLTGLEWAVGVPGSVGGGVRMNAGGHGSDMAAHLVRVHLFDLRVGAARGVAAAALGLAFRHSSIGDHEIVVDATFTLAAGDRSASERLIADIVRWRRENQPGGQNAGSVFVNPLPRSAGEIIDRLGLRGLRHGTAEVSTKHANFIQADDGGSADDVHALMELVRAKVRAAEGITLRSEVRLVGFDHREASP